MSGVVINNSNVTYFVTTKTGITKKTFVITGWDASGEPMIVDSGRLIRLDTWLRKSGSTIASFDSHHI